MSGTQKDNVSPSRLGYTHGFETMSDTTAYHNHIKNYELETREVFEWGTETIPLTRQTDLMTTLHNNPLSVDRVSGLLCKVVFKSVCRVSGIFSVSRSKTFQVSN